MDPIVAAALRKWPRVPHCYGWLGLDQRGDWYMRDDRVQAAGPFALAKGSRIEHDRLRDFIARNYTSDAAGAWFFQNGPQRVYVELEAAPWVWRLAQDASGAIVATSHTGLAATLGASFVDEAGRVFAAADLGLGLVHTLDMDVVAGAVESGDWLPTPTTFATLIERYRYRLSPASAPA